MTILALAGGVLSPNLAAGPSEPTVAPAAADRSAGTAADHVGAPQGGPADPSCPLPPGRYSYNELRAADCPVAPDELGGDPNLPPCEEDPNWNGFETADEAEAAIARGPEEAVCTIVVGPDDPSFIIGGLPTGPAPG
jgi:hypothetical protein